MGKPKDSFLKNMRFKQKNVGCRFFSGGGGGLGGCGEGGWERAEGLGLRGMNLVGGKKQGQGKCLHKKKLNFKKGTKIMISFIWGEFCCHNS